jgi:hypothetical protein
VGLLKKAVTANTAIISAADILLTDPGYTGNDIKPNQTGFVAYTVEVLPSVSGLVSAVFTNAAGTVTDSGVCYTCTAGYFNIFEITMRAKTNEGPWTLNLKYSQTCTMTLCISEHGGVV